jgi:glycine/D-amino acid oxidase-like deaminating enzyme
MTDAADGRGLTRRELLEGIAGTAALSAVGGRIDSAATAPLIATAPRTTSAAEWDAIVVGAGAFGAWTAWHLRREGRRVLLVDASGPANARASSGGESRMTRATYGADAVYARMAHASLDDWRWLSARAGLPIFHPIGVLMFFDRPHPYADASVETSRLLGLRFEVLDRAALERRWPQIDWAGIAFGLFEPDFGPLMARRAVQTLVREYVAAGGEYRLASILPPGDGSALEGLRTSADDVLRADRYVFACGPHRLPGWSDFNGGDVYYGFPNLESRGFKIAHDAHGPRFDPDTGDRQPTAAGLAEIRAYLRRRFPALAARPLVESRVCQYENSSNGDLLIDVHPQWPNALLVGAGSGHGFKHAPAVGRYVAALLGGAPASIEPRFSLASKGESQRREVH